MINQYSDSEKKVYQMSFYIYLDMVYDDIYDEKDTSEINIKNIENKFYDFFDLPIIISKNFFDSLQNEKNKFLKKKAFIEGTFILFNSFLCQKYDSIFYLYKFFKNNNENMICRESILLILNNLLLKIFIKGKIFEFNLLIGLIIDVKYMIHITFEDKIYLNFDNFLECLTKNEKCLRVIMIIFYLASPVKSEIIENMINFIYKNDMKESIKKYSIYFDNNFKINSDHENYDDKYKRRNNFLNYLIEFKNYEEDYCSDTDEFSKLNEFTERNNIQDFEINPINLLERNKGKNKNMKNLDNKKKNLAKINFPVCKDKKLISRIDDKDINCILGLDNIDFEDDEKNIKDMLDFSFVNSSREKKKKYHRQDFKNEENYHRISDFENMDHFITKISCCFNHEKVEKNDQFRKNIENKSVIDSFKVFENERISTLSTNYNDKVSIISNNKKIKNIINDYHDVEIFDLFNKKIDILRNNDLNEYFENQKLIELKKVVIEFYYKSHMDFREILMFLFFSMKKSHQIHEEKISFKVLYKNTKINLKKSNNLEEENIILSEFDNFSTYIIGTNLILQKFDDNDTNYVDLQYDMLFLKNFKVGKTYSYFEKNEEYYLINLFNELEMHIILFKNKNEIDSFCEILKQNSIIFNLEDYYIIENSIFKNKIFELRDYSHKTKNIQGELKIFNKSQVINTKNYEEIFESKYYSYLNNFFSNFPYSIIEIEEDFQCYYSFSHKNIQYRKINQINEDFFEKNKVNDFSSYFIRNGRKLKLCDYVDFSKKDINNKEFREFFKFFKRDIINDE